MTTPLPPLNNCTVAVIGLGYVGLPLAVEFAKPQACCRTGAALQRRVIGFDINCQRLDELRLAGGGGRGSALRKVGERLLPWPRGAGGGLAPADDTREDDALRASHPARAHFDPRLADLRGPCRCV